MEFSEVVRSRQSCRSYDSAREVTREDIDAIVSLAVLAPSACNSQPYRLTVCTGETAGAVAEGTQQLGMNKFTSAAPCFIVISEAPANPPAALINVFKDQNFGSIDIGILAANITLAAADRGLATCILGWIDDKKMRRVLGTDSRVRLIIALGYASPDYPLRPKKRRDLSETVRYM